MSKRKVPKYCLVIDASIARPAGSPESTHRTGIKCREFLTKVLVVSHRMAWTEAIKREWEKHESTFALRWRRKMESKKKVVEILNVGTEATDEIAEACPDEHVRAIVHKDCHLIEAALASDSRIASLDDVARGHFSRLSATVECLREIVWVDPTKDEEAAVKWLERGAPAEKKRQLKNH